MKIKSSFIKALEKLKSLSRIKKMYVGIIATTIIGTLVYHYLNLAPQKWDSAAHMNLALLYALKFKELRFSEIPTLSGYYPPFVHLLGGIFLLFFNTTKILFALTLAIYIVGLYFLYKLANLLINNSEYALLTAVIFSLFTQTFVESRLFQLDLPLTVFTVIAIYYLHTSDALNKKRETILFFIFASIAQLTKWYAFIYFVVPFFYEFFRIIKTETKNETGDYTENTQNNTKLFNPKKFINLLTGLIVATVLNASWYIVNYNNILSFFKNVSSVGELSDAQNPLSKTSLLEYFNLSLAFQISFMVFLIVILSLIYTLIKETKKASYYALAVLLPWAIFTLIVNKDVRYIMPILPFYALVITTAVYNVRKVNKALSYGIIACILLFQIFTYFFISFNQYNQLPNNLSLFNRLYTSPNNKYQWIKNTPSVYSYQTSDWEIENVYKRLIELDEDIAKDSNILFAVDYPYFNVLEFTTLQLENGTYYQARAGYDLVSNSFVEAFLNNPYDYNYKYIITSYDPGPRDVRHYENMVKINRFLQKDNNKTYQSVGSFALPNGEDVYIFRKNDVVAPLEIENEVEESTASQTTQKSTPFSAF